MAMYDINATKGFFSELANDQDVCYFCEKETRKEFSNKGISFDEMSKKLKDLRGKEIKNRVVKLTYLGHELCICKNCLSKAQHEIEMTGVKSKPDAKPADDINTNKEENPKGKTNASKKG
jgi:hypothetical protein